MPGHPLANFAAGLAALGASADLLSGVHSYAKPLYGARLLGVGYVGGNGAGARHRDVHPPRHCDPDFSASCKRHYARMFKRAQSKSKIDYAPFGPELSAELAGDYASGRPISQ